MDSTILIGKIVRERRNALGLTQAELARRVGCAPITVRKIEADALRPSLQIAELLAWALNIPEEEHLGFVQLARAEKPPRPIPTPGPAPDEIGSEDLSGRAVRGYRLGERIGAGGFGAIYQAIQPGIARPVAIKIILPTYANNPVFIRRFEAEAQIVSRLEHPHIVPLYDYWREPDAAYLVMRLMQGGSLAEQVKRGPLETARVWKMLLQVGQALDVAHQAGVIHCDIKPANILLDEYDNTYLGDFGIAKQVVETDDGDWTKTDVLIGSPAYLAPEQIMKEKILPQTDIYSLGIMLYELLAGRKPFRGSTPIAYIQQHLNDPLPPLHPKNGDLPQALDAVLARATAKEPGIRYPNVLEFIQAVQEALPQVAEEAFQISPVGGGIELPTLTTQALRSLVNPFKGLQPYLEADAEIFFGRDSLVQDLLTRLGEASDLSAGKDLARFLAVVGPSGSGKSSVVRAGLVPALRRGGLPDSDQWFIVEMLPGTHPFEELEAALLRVAVNPPASLLQQLVEDERGLLRAVWRVLPPDNETELVLVIDQFEELFTLVEDEVVRFCFLNSLVTAVLDPRSRVRVIVTMRADFTDRVLSYVDFGELVRQRAEFVLPLTPDELEQVIVRPVESCGMRFEPELVQMILRDLSNQPGTLPLLQYALTELFERRDGRVLKLAAYQENGGALGALRRRAEQIYTTFDPERQEITRQLFLRLVTLGSGGESMSPDTRRRVLRSELLGLGGENSAAVVDEVLDRFGRYRLLTFDRDPVTRGPTVEIAHEALLREWPRFHDWIADSREDLRAERALSQITAEWMEKTRNPGFLLRGARLDQYAAWWEETDLVLTGDERAFLQASLDARMARRAEEAVRLAREAQLEQRSQTFLRWLVGVFAAAALIAIILSVFAFNQQGLAQENAATAAAAQGAALYEKATAVAAEALAQRQAEIAAEQARVAQVRELAAAALNQLDRDPELGILLAMEAVNLTYNSDQTVLGEAESALHQAVQASHIERMIAEFPLWDYLYTPDGGLLVGITRDKRVLIWNVMSGEVLQEFSAGEIGKATSPARIDISHDGKLLAGLDRDGAGAIWNLGTGEILMTFSDAAYGIDALPAFSLDGFMLATTSKDGGAKLWDVKTGVLIDTLKHPTGGVTNMVFSPNEAFLATTATSGDIILWDLETRQLQRVLTGHTAYVDGAIFSPDGTLLASNGLDSNVIVWDVASGEKKYTFPNVVGGDPGRVLAFSPDGKRLAMQDASNLVVIWDIESGKERYSFLCLPGMLGFVFSPDWTQMTASSHQFVKQCNPLPDHEFLAIDGHAAAVHDVAFSPDGTKLATGSHDGTARVWDFPITRQQEMILGDSPAWVLAVNFSPDGKFLATATGDYSGTASNDDTGRIWDLESGAEVVMFAGHEAGVTDIAFSPDMTRIATAGLDNTVRIWDARNGILLYTLPHGWFVFNVEFHQDGKQLAAAGADSYARIYDTSSGEVLLSVGDSTFFSTSYNWDYKGLLTGTSGGSITMWDSMTGEAVYNTLEVGYIVSSLAVRPGGNQFASGGFSGEVEVWNAKTGEKQLSLAQLPEAVWGMDFSPDGKYLAVANWDGIARVYILDIQDLIGLAKTRVTRGFTLTECQIYLHSETCPGP